MRQDGPEPVRYSKKTELRPSIETFRDGAVELRITGCETTEVRQTFFGFEIRSTICHFAIVNKGTSSYAFPRPSGSIAFEYRKESPRSCSSCFTMRLRPAVTERRETNAYSGRGAWEGTRSDQSALPAGAAGDAFANDSTINQYEFPTALFYAGRRIELVPL